MKSVIRITLAIFMVFSLSSCNDEPQEVTSELLIYCGITMIKPMNQLAKEFEANHNVKITLTQGGSQDLYDSLKLSQKGDIYFPGSSSYRKKNVNDGLLSDYKFVGYNRVAMMVQKGNPKNITNDLNQFTSNDLAVVLCNPHSGSIGRASAKVLDKAGIKEAAFDNATYLTTDSRRLVESLKNKDSDIVLNWYAAGTWAGASEYVDVIELDQKFSKPKPLELNLLTFSTNKVNARAFMDYAASAHGLQTFKQYGFLTEPELKVALNNLSKQ